MEGVDPIQITDREFALLRHAENLALPIDPDVLAEDGGVWFR